MRFKSSSSKDFVSVTTLNNDSVKEKIRDGQGRACCVTKENIDIYWHYTTVYYIGYVYYYTTQSTQTQTYSRKK